jgi:guanosine-3',5'-bis(diphosphate) 3'-pyrophosphohydrolase
MNEVAEYGVAAHSIYKDGASKNGAGKDVSSETSAYAWLRRTIEQLAEGDNPEDFLENTKLELFQDQVFCFTPKGMVIALPRGATPIDFAYAVHTDVGDSCVGAKVNGRIMPLMTELKNGDEVEIIRSKAQVPPAAWESIVVTGKARSAIRRATKNAIRKQYSGLGMRILERAFERTGKPFSRDSLKLVLPRLARKDVEDVLSAVGRGELSSADVIKAVFPDYKDERVTAPVPKQREEGWSRIRNAAGMLFQLPGRSSRKGKSQPKDDGALPIRGVRGDLPVTFAPEGAVPGDRIVGIVQPGSGITIYPIQSPSLTAFDDQPERWIDVRWDIDENNRERFPARISVTAINAPGSLADIAQVVASNDANIHTLSMVRTAPDFTEMLIDIEVWDVKHLNRLLSQLKENPSVSTARRVNG